MKQKQQGGFFGLLPMLMMQKGGNKSIRKKGQMGGFLNWKGFTQSDINNWERSLENSSKRQKGGLLTKKIASNKYRKKGKKKL